MRSFSWQCARVVLLVVTVGLGSVSPAGAERLSAAPMSAEDGAGALALRLPLSCLSAEGGCTLARTLDHQPEAGKDQDFRCGPRASNDHSGTDIAVRDMITAGKTAVLAAASGRVKGVRDGMNDLGTRRQPPESLKSQECGNGVVLDHGNGWETQYCHLRQGSITVRVGEKVKAGKALGKVGMSGWSEFPHLHFAVRYQGKPVDPFTGTSAETPCGGAEKPLWTPQALAALPYQPSGFYHAGVSSGRPELTAARDGGYRDMPLATAPALVLWAELLAPRAGDEVHFSLALPDGAVIIDQYVNIEKDQAQWFGFAGARSSADQWPLGTYRASVTLKRQADGQQQALDVPLVIKSPSAP